MIRNTILFCGLLIILSLQYGWAQSNTYPSTGKVGLGTIQPEAPLHIFSSISDRALKINGTDKNTTVWLHVAGGDYGYLALGGDTRLRGNGKHSVFEGNVGIGTNSPSHKLEVNGTARAREVKVEASPWPDYVFDSRYPLMPLDELELYVTTKGHLPNIPTEAEVLLTGIELGKMNAKLLEKVEELTLYLIQHEKIVREQAKLLEDQENRLKELEERILNKP